MSTTEYVIIFSNQIEQQQQQKKKEAILTCEGCLAVVLLLIIQPSLHVTFSPSIKKREHLYLHAYLVNDV